MLRFLSGAQEAERFTLKDYIALHQSTLRKVDLLSDIAERAHYRTLKTDATWWPQNGGSVHGALNWLAENKMVALLLTLVGIAIGAVRLPAAFSFFRHH